jgi:hypothetical protein
MNKNEMMIAVLRNQKILLDELVNVLEQTEVVSVEDYSYCGNRAKEIIRNLKSVSRFALSEAGKDIVPCEEVSSR